ncbi:isochorismatase family protein [Cobetia sp. MB87]|uniref:isochorismatase family protein n=1 Tax=Cobetia sp. MB87 TaxID=2588451 RepID=UPI00140CE68E|nr:isochorismatase family protein [Cobetia sp. MB87]NHH86335.1 hypothetical protein [Cobetia sp. MB87]
MVSSDQRFSASSAPFTSETQDAATSPDVAAFCVVQRIPATPAEWVPPGELDARLPVRPDVVPVSLPTAGLIIVDEINGFCQVAGGALAPQAPNAQVSRMIALSDTLARTFSERRRPLLVFIDSHAPGKSEPPYPAHCEQGSGEDELVAELAWLEEDPQATLVRKDCINGYVGAIDLDTQVNALQEWVSDEGLETLVVVGICTDICVMDLVLTLLSARNHGLLGKVRDIVVLEPGCATYDLPAEVVAQLGLPDTATHPQADSHHIGLYCMAARGAVIASQLELTS